MRMSSCRASEARADEADKRPVNAGRFAVGEKSARRALRHAATVMP